MRTSSTGAGELAGHRMQLSYFLFTSPEGGGKTRLGGELRREEQLLPQAGMSTDRDGTIDGLSEGVFTCLSPLAPARPESHRSRGQAGPPRPAQADRPRSSASPQRLEQAAYRETKTSDTFLFHNVYKKMY
jgi:hypothetical protein